MVTKKTSSNFSSIIRRCFSPIQTLLDTLPNGIFAVSLFGLFLGASTTMVYNLLGLFMKNELHASESTISSIDGIVECLAYVIRIFSGMISDYYMDRKNILVIGCVIIFFMKPFFAFANSSIDILIAQSVERIGNGLQASPRDALITDLSDKHTRGRSFGFSKSFKTVGSLLGTCMAIVIMYFSNNNFRLVFMCGTIMVAISMLCLCKIKTPKDIERETSGTQKVSLKYVDTTKKIENPFKMKYLKSLDSFFWKMVVFACIFELGHFTESLLPIYANQFLSITKAGGISMFVSLGQVMCSLPIGLYADKFGKRRFILVCIC
ncbi:MAG: MFS transporter, partial [Holosporaceae bacterium]|nr:MFS transporter [Holosporaceae bacterium]